MDIKNDNKFRPLRISHYPCRHSYFTPYPIAMKKARKNLENLLRMGYGGIVSNVFTGKKAKYLYLKKERCFKFFKGIVELCKELGLRVWIYDECGYPSGGALGQVVKNDPDTEAYGIICIAHTLKQGESVTINLPRGHEKVKAVLFETDNETINITHLADSTGSITYTAEYNGTIYYIASKVLFEGVHPSEKFSRACRYIDVMDKKAVSDFINITYDKYKKHVGEYFGNVIEAFFTDEPSVMNQYFSKINYKYKPIDKPDKDFPFYRFIAWSRGYEEEFLKRKGYDITSHIPELFKDLGDNYSKIKQDYFEVCAELYKEAYFDAISNFCDQNNLKFSGHLLGEETLALHCLNEFDYFKMLKTMHYPGIDVLTCEPKNLLNKPLLLKTASSAAKMEGKTTIMSETSFHSDDKTKIFKEKTLCALLIQYAKGITQITSYLSHLYMNNKEYSWIFNRLSKIGKCLQNSDFVTPLLIYYPVKSLFGYFAPTLKKHNQMDYNKIFGEISSSFNKNLLCFQSHQLDFDIIDNQNFLNLFTEVKNISLKNYKAVYIPMCNFEAEGIENTILKLIETGISVYIQNSKLLPESIKSLKGITLVENAEEATNIIFSNKQNDIYIRGNYAENIICCHKQSATESLYMLVNSLEEEIKLSVTLKEDSTPTFYDIIKDTETEFRYQNNGKETVSEITLEPYGACLITFER